MTTSFLQPYIFSIFNNILLSVHAWTLLLFTCAVIIIFAFRIRKEVEEKLSIPSLNVSGITLIYITAKQILSKKCGPLTAYFQFGVAMTQLFPKEGIFCAQRIIKPCVVLYRAETVEPVLNSKNLKKGFEYELLVKLQDGIFSRDIETWRGRRKLITPAFSTKILDDFCLTFNEKAITFAEQIMELIKFNKFIRIDSLLLSLTLQLMCETAMGLKDSDSRKNVPEYLQAVIKFDKLLMKRILMPWLWPNAIFWRSKIGNQLKKIHLITHKFLSEVILEKKMEKQVEIGKNTQKENSEFKTTGKKKRSTFLNHLLDIHFQDNTFSTRDIAVEIDSIMDAGSITTALNMSWVLYLLGLHPDVQRKVHEELDRVLDVSSPITKYHVKELKYLDSVIKETARLYPPVPYISRELNQETIINGYKVPKGTTCGIFIYALHRNPEIFPNPEVFDPDRFNYGEKRPTYAYIPFSAGPRNCIGKPFAKLEMLILLATLLHRFKVKSMLPVDKILLSVKLTLTAKNGLYVAFEPRKEFLSKYERKS